VLSGGGVVATSITRRLPIFVTANADTVIDRAHLGRDHRVAPPDIPNRYCHFTAGIGYWIPPKRYTG